MNPDLRIGYGFDIHTFADNRKLILGGVEVPYHKGLAGHSDADVLTHAVIDALLGAVALGDIGAHFPDTDPRYKDADSIELLKHCISLLSEKGYQVGNIDATVVTEKPKLREFIDAIRMSIAGACEISVDRISVKATTSEKVGFAGRGEGMSATAVCIVSK